ncbi:MAG: PKD domain-containing protein, partial [Dermatophilaceae bacterium]
MAQHSRKSLPRGISLALALLLSVFASLTGAPLASAETIVSIGGPLTQITISPDLNCDVQHLGDSSGEWFGATACATLVSAGGVLFGPAYIPAGGSATGVTGYTPYTPVSQTGPTGAGTTADPYTVVTIVDLGSSGLRLTQTDTYVEGGESYRTDVKVTTSGAAGEPVKVYRGGDCYLQDSDTGLGRVDLGIAPVCVAEPGSKDLNRIEGFYPLTVGSHYIEDNYDTVWAAIGSQTNLPDTCACADLIDNGIAINWDVTVPTGAAGITLSSLTIFSPVGAAPASFSKTADAASTAAGGTNGYTVTVTNPGASSTTLTSITDTLSPGFSYLVGSTTGATTTDPAVNGQALTWTGSFVVPAATANTPGTLTLHFGVTVSTTPGTYTNSVTGAGTGVTVIPAIDTAPITVTPVVSNQPPTASAGGPYAGVEGSAIPLTGSASDPDADSLTYAWTYSSGAGVDAGATCSFANSAALSTTITCTDDGTYTASLSVNDGNNPAVVKTASVVVSNAAPTVVITSPADMSVVMVGQTVTLTSTYADAGANDTHTYSVDFGDGSAPVTGTATGGTISVTHTYAAIGTYDVTVTVTDDDNGVGTASITLVAAGAANQPPTASAGGPYAGVEGSAIPLTGSASDPDA